MSTKSKSLYLLLVGILLLQACSISQVQPTPSLQPTQTLVPPTPTQPTATPTEPPFESIHLGMVWPEEANLIGGVADSNGVIYAMDQEGILHAVDTSGTELWSYHGEYKKASSPIFEPQAGTIYFITDSNQLFAINKDGKKKWVFDVGDRIVAFPKVGPDGSVYLETTDTTSQMSSSKINRVLPNGTQQSFSLSKYHYLSDATIGSNGNIFVWDWKGLTILSPSGERISECINISMEQIASNILASSNELQLFVDDGGKVTAVNDSCSISWASSIETSEDYAFEYHLDYDGKSALFVGGPNGVLYAFDTNNGKQIWKSDPSPEIGEITNAVALKNGFTYAVSNRGNIMAFDPQGKRKWVSELYAPGIPVKLQVMPNDELLFNYGNQLLIYTHDTTRSYKNQTEMRLPSSEEEVRKEIVSFVVDFIVENEIGGTADYIRTSGMPWVDSPPEANIIVYAPPLETPERSWRPLDSQNPITVWWYANNELTEVEDMQKAIDEYRNIYIENASPSIFAWGKYDFGIIKIGPDFRSAEIYVGASCGLLCGHGYNYKLQRSPSGKWWIYDSTELWVS